MKRLLVLILLAGIGAGLWAAHPKGADGPLDLPAPQTSFAPLPSALTLAVIGTSLTADAAWPEDITAHLQNCTQGTVTLQRLAKGGQTSAWGVANIANLLDAPPDVALIEFTINDADIRRGISIEDSATNHRALIKALRQANPDVQIILLRLNRAYGLRAMLRPQLAAYEQSLAEIAQIETVDLLDLRPLWASAGRGSLSDGLHPTPDAVEQITTPALRRTLPQKLGLGCG